MGFVLLYIVSFKVQKTWKFFVLTSLLQFAWISHFVFRNWYYDVWVNSPLLYPVAFIYALLVGLGLTLSRSRMLKGQWHMLDNLILFSPILLMVAGLILQGLNVPSLGDILYKTNFINIIKYATNWKLNLQFLEGGWSVMLYVYNLVFVMLVFLRNFKSFKINSK